MLIELHLRDKISMRELKQKQEDSLRNALADDRYECLYDGAWAETIGSGYRFKPVDSSVHSELITNIRNYIIYKNLRADTEDMIKQPRVYGSVNEPVYYYCVEEIKDSPGISIILKMSCNL